MSKKERGNIRFEKNETITNSKKEIGLEQLEKLLNGDDDDLFIAIWDVFCTGEDMSNFTYEQKAVVGRLAARIQEIKPRVKV